MTAKSTTHKLVRQTYGIACAQAVFGGPRGVWLECTACPRSEVIAGSTGMEWASSSIPDAECAKIFRQHGWTGDGDKMLRAKCPACAAANAEGE